MAIGGSTAAAAEVEPKRQPFADERTGSQRRASGAWAKGEGEGAKILALRPAEPGDAEPTAVEAAPVQAPAEAEPSEVVSERPRPQDATSSGVRAATSSVRPSGASGEHRKPLVLASESLRADIAPNDPGRGVIRFAAAALGGAGAIATVAVAGLAPASLLVAAGLASMAALGALRLDYRRRAWGLLAVALPGLVATSVLAAPHGGVPQGTLLALTVSGLAGALYFRAEYRASRLARGLVATGVAAGAVWLAASGALAGLTTLGAAWQSWLPCLLAASFALVLTLALLGFMTHNSTGGCSAWATTLLVWLLAYESAVHAAALFPLDGPALASGWHLGVAMGAVATPLFAAVAAMAFAHLLVVASGGGREALVDAKR